MRGEMAEKSGLKGVPWFVLAVSAVALAMALWVAAVSSYSLPAYEEGHAKRPDANGWWKYRGSMHLHTSYSHDSKTPPADVIIAAGNNELDFIVITDHENQEARKDTGFREGLLIMAGMEASATAGHFLVLGADAELTEKQQKAADFGVVRALGGISVIAHPFGGRTPWHGLDKGGFEGVEIINMKTELEDALSFPFLGVASAALAWPFNERYAVMSVYRRPDAALEYIDRSGPNPPFIICGADAHGFPSNQLVMGACVNHVMLPEKMAGEYLHDSALVLEAIRAGNNFVAMDGFARADLFSYVCAETKDGKSLKMSLAGSPAAVDASAKVFFGGRVVGSCGSLERECAVAVPPAGAVRIEVTLKTPGALRFGSEISWIHAIACGE